MYNVAKISDFLFLLCFEKRAVNTGLFFIQSFKISPFFFMTFRVDKKFYSSYVSGKKCFHGTQMMPQLAYHMKC